MVPSNEVTSGKLVFAALWLPRGKPEYLLRSILNKRGLRGAKDCRAKRLLILKGFYLCSNFFKPLERLKKE